MIYLDVSIYYKKLSFFNASYCLFFEWCNVHGNNSCTVTFLSPLKPASLANASLKIHHHTIYLCFKAFLLWFTEVDFKIKKLPEMNSCSCSTGHWRWEIHIGRGQLNDTEKVVLFPDLLNYCKWCPKNNVIFSMFSFQNWHLSGTS